LITITYYFRSGDAGCELADQNLELIRKEIPFEIVRVDIDSDPSLTSIFNKAVPVVKAGPYTLQGDISIERLRMTLGAASDRLTHLEKIGDQRFRERYKNARNFSSMDRVTDWLSHHYLALFNIFLLTYSGLPFLAPMLMKTGLPLPAQVIYTVYSPLCHQMAFRSWFLFGEQPYYPRELAGVPGVLSYEQVIESSQVVPETSDRFVFDARSFIGNDLVGYKVALCERDVALYGGMLVFGLVFAITQRKIKQIPWYIWLVFGLIPIGFDGASQIPSLIAGLPDWLPLRESTPLWRTVTGGLFGGLSAWYLFPIFEQTMKDTRALLVSKKEVISQTRSSE
jgi:uncharacterized membrane protein